MYQRLLASLLFIGLLHTTVNASGVSAFSFVDGRWSGGIETEPNSSGGEECWASTKFSDGTIFTLTKRSDGSWHLRLSNPEWRLPPSHRYDMIAQVDFYPHLRIAAEAKSQTRLEIANINHISLLAIIENGHTIDLMSDGFNAKYDLEGSAKIIARVGNCKPISLLLKGRRQHMTKSDRLVIPQFLTGLDSRTHAASCDVERGKANSWGAFG